MTSQLPPHILPVAIGGALGAVLRHAVGHSVATAAPDHPYLATLAVNIGGSTALGMLAAFVLHRPGHLPREVEYAVMVGLLGALTTYSTFSTDAVKLVHDGRAWLAAAYVVTTTFVCLGLASAGFAIVGKLVGPVSHHP